MHAARPDDEGRRRGGPLIHGVRVLAIGIAAAAAASALGPVGAGSVEAEPIQDNSFLIEEAYNQEPGVVQHISTLRRSRDGTWSYAFTQEWPLGGSRHQLSFTVPFHRAGDDAGRSRGIGDAAVHYRLQALGDEGPGSIAFAPRFSLLLPTGDERDGLGTGGTGVEIGLPVSAALGERFVAHANAGGSLVPSAKNAAGHRAGTFGYRIGASLVWLSRPDLNVLFEAAWERAEEPIGPDRTERERALRLSPGIRFALNLPGGLQIVPGVALPIGAGPSSGQRDVFLYLSFEHPFRRAAATAAGSRRRIAARPTVREEAF